MVGAGGSRSAPRLDPLSSSPAPASTSSSCGRTYFIISAEAGGATQSGLLSGVSFAAIVVGLLTGAPIFGLTLQAFDSYGAAWTVFAVLSGVVAVVVAACGAAIHRECQPALAR